MATAAPGDELRLPVARDTWVSSAKGEEEGNNGGERRLKAKSYQEMTLLDLDIAPLRGRVIERATLHFRSVSGPPLRRATVSSVASPWTEGTSRNYAREVGAASFRFAETGRRAWTDRGGDLSDVVLSAGNTLWAFADATPPDENGWQSLSVDPRVLATRVAGVGFGFLLFDDVGSEYTRDGDKFAYHPFPNRFIASREAGAESAPYLTVERGGVDSTPPPAIEDFGAERELHAEEGFTLWWSAPVDRAAQDEVASGTLGYFMRYSTEPDFEWEIGREVPQYYLPQNDPSQTLVQRGSVRALLPELPVDPKVHVYFAVRAVDAAGNVSSAARATAWFTGALPPPPELVRPPRAETPPTPLKLGAVQVAVLDELDKLDLNAEVLPPSMAAPGTSARFSLYGSAGEWLGFQIALLGPTRGLRAQLTLEPSVLRTQLFVARGVTTPAGRFPDPLEAWDGQSEIAPGPDRVTVLFVEVFVPRHIGLAVVTGRVRLELATDHLELPLRICIRDGSLPDGLSFVPEMNAYDLPPPPFEIEWYRLAHEHRTNLNVLRYDWKGRVHEGCGPKIVDGEFQWQEFDERFGPLFDGSAFADGSRGPIPVEMFYLPLNENWPVPIAPHFQGGYWADTALDAVYWSEFERNVRRLGEHVGKLSRLPRTTFEFYLNNKLYHKGTDWNGSSAPWIFDEPTHTQDFFALRCFARAFKQGLGGVRRAENVVFRLDDSRPQWRRDLLDGLVGVHVVGSAFDRYRERVLEKKRAFHERLMLYATANAVEASNVMPAAWCIDAWLKGADGVIPWQTIGRAESWEKGDPLALLYPPRDGKPGPPVPSLRLKAFRRGQQDVEYLEQYRALSNGTRAEVAQRVGRLVDLRSNARARFEDDAGELEYPNVTPRALAELRRALFDALLAPR
ncbi:MAG: DUF4091 domain-containing protein [Planctomycetes bacterium]|nr:DUF4091 domain-containing protein [Planctomycetota bacterium]